MNQLVSTTIWQIFLILFLIARDKNNGEKELFKIQPWQAIDVLLVFFLINIFTYLVYFLSTVHSMRPFLMSTHMYLFHMFLFLLMAGLIRFRANQNYSILGFKKKDALQNVIGLGITTAFIIYSIDNILYLAFSKNINYAASIINDLKSIENPFDYFIYGVMVIILAPIIEESLYRGILYSPYRKKYGPVKAIFITALLFSVGHYGTNILRNFIVGIFLGTLYEKKESLMPSIIAHSVNNLLGIVTALYFIYGK